MSQDAQLILMILGTGITGFALSAFWGRAIRPESFDRDAILFFAKMWFGVAGGFIVLYFLMKYKYL